MEINRTKALREDGMTPMRRIGERRDLFQESMLMFGYAQNIDLQGDASTHGSAASSKTFMEALASPLPVAVISCVDKVSDGGGSEELR